MASKSGVAKKKRTGTLWSHVDESLDQSNIVNNNNNNTSTNNALEVNDDDAERRRRTSVAPRMAAPKLSHAQISDLLTTVIKLSTNNQIDQGNCWALESTATYLSSACNEGFQMAASALDASTKIYSARVDSVHTESFKVLSGLNRADGEGKSKNKADGADVDEVADDHEPGEKAKRKAVRVTPTVVKHDDDINGPPLLYVYEEDPLVRKTAVAFDGTANGLLLNQLSVFAGSTLVFDSGDVPEETGRVFEENPTKMLLDTSDLTLTFQSLLENLDNLYICPEAADFHVEQPVQDDGTAQQLRQLPIFVEAQDEPYNVESAAVVGASLERAPSSQVPIMLPMESDNDMYADDGGGGFNNDDDDLDDQPRDFDADGNIVASPSAAVVVAPSSAAAAPAMVPVEVATKVPVIVRGQITDGPGQPLADEIARALAIELGSSLAANSNAWAGPERWGFRKISAKGAVQSLSPSKGAPVADGDADPAAAGESVAKQSGAQRKKKGANEQFFIDFTQPADQDWESAFEPPRKGGTTLTKQQKEKAKAAATVLPPDLHYGTTNLMSLFTKPKWMIPKHQFQWRPIVDPTAQGQTILSAVMEPDAQQSKATEWFDKRQANADPLNVDGGDGYNDDDDGGMDYGGGGDDLMFNPSSQPDAQVQHRPVRPITELNVAHMDMLVPAPQQLEHIQLGFARMARAVNVKALKATLWKGIEHRQEPFEVGKRKSVPIVEQEEAQPFQDLLNELPKKLPAFEKSNVSVAFCFISLLHLANDHGLELQNENLTHLAIKQTH